MANLLVEIGNTALKAAWAEGTTLGKTFRYQGEKMFGFIDSLIEKEKPSVMVISSTIDIDESEERNLRSKCGSLVILDNNHTDTAAGHGLPRYLPSDRVASLIAANHLFEGSGVMVFDFGTTLTIDIIDRDGRYEGGNISPGCRTRFKAINRYSRRLPLAHIPTNVRDTGDSLLSSIESGVIGGIMFEIQGYLSLFPEKIAVFTGGDALYFAKKMKNSIFVVCNLVLMGLALIADDYV
ncbi:MAG: type III pantothenate kinase [Bacteroidales bacterium]|nr:type III pantothenate kinase [Bacteroidales bacterium]